MSKLNQFVILDGEGPQEMFGRLMTMVGKIRGYGCDELDDHKVVKIMLEAYSPRNEIVVTLIRDKKKFEYFTPNDVLGRILTFDMQREEATEEKAWRIASKARRHQNQQGCSSQGQQIKQERLY